MHDPDDFIPDALEETPEASTVKNLNRRDWLKMSSLGALAAAGGGAGMYYYSQMPLLNFDGRYARATNYHPPVIHSLVMIANQIVDKPYKWGGGHQQLFDNGFDCSGSISHILYRTGLLTRPLNSKGFATYGMPGAGRYVSIFVKPGSHVFMSVCGLRFDTSGTQTGEGPRWRSTARSSAGFTNRHPNGL
ncbi:hypothetical protein SAMN02745166_01766 [Prosthecobacter debontii]|uniref:Uncharacterized protein n=1 Tax=Prosthecobacter debontii TaxID=48467 RepID=A0A1T4XQL5_9BACT|nr:C40 family peptidase [Prosthecobacter debontii]SKA91653.1 hypothetical protein SAMN02745166_01766 [Prosthecobacter debontii]